jgi:hypothetical protein
MLVQRVTRYRPCTPRAGRGGAGTAVDNDDDHFLFRPSSTRRDLQFVRYVRRSVLGGAKQYGFISSHHVWSSAAGPARQLAARNAPRNKPSFHARVAAMAWANRGDLECRTPHWRRARRDCIIIGHAARNQTVSRLQLENRHSSGSRLRFSAFCAPPSARPFRGCSTPLKHHLSGKRYQMKISHPQPSRVVDKVFRDANQGTRNQGRLMNDTSDRPTLRQGQLLGQSHACKQRLPSQPYLSHQTARFGMAMRLHMLRRLEPLVWQRHRTFSFASRIARQACVNLHQAGYGFNSVVAALLRLSALRASHVRPVSASDCSTPRMARHVQIFRKADCLPESIWQLLNYHRSLISVWNHATFAHAPNQEGCIALSMISCSR